MEITTMPIVAKFNERERKISDCFLKGFLTSKELANELDIPITTINFFFERAFRIYGVNSRSSLFKILLSEKQDFFIAEIQNFLRDYM
jgi:DNA-binding CsgD family transcriptional regulator